MKILGIDSSGMVASVALVCDETIIAEYTVNYKKTHSQTLMPMLQEIIEMTEQELSEIDAIAIAGGPGSFTGLRIGSATAKGLAMAVDKPIVAVPTLDAIAFNIYGFDGLICPMMDARRSEVYTGVYNFDEAGEFMTVLSQCAIPVRDVIGRLNEYGKRVVLLGDGALVYADIIKEELRVPYLFAPAHLNRQRASSVACLGGIYYKKGLAMDAASFSPEYLRKSQAEREKGL